MKILSSLILVITLSACASNVQESSELGYQGYKSNDSKTSKVLQILEDLKKRPEAKIRKNQGWTIVNINTAKEKVIWSFTPEVHAAYPSAVKREVVEKNGSVYIDTKVNCEATKNICDQLVKDFISLNKNISGQFK